MRRTLVLLVALLALGAAPALAQTTDAVQDDTLEQALPTPTAAPDPCRTPDADYTYACQPCRGADLDYQTDADYAYCSDAVPTGTQRPRRKRPEQVRALPAAAALPLTGSEPLLVGMAGLGLLLAGTGLRFTTAAARRP